MTFRIDHASHLHPATPQARAICRKETAAFEARVDALTEELLTAWSWYTREDMVKRVLGCAVRLGAISEEQAYGTYGYNAGGEWVCDTSTIVYPREAVREILRVSPDFTRSTFNRMYS